MALVELDLLFVDLVLVGLLVSDLLVRAGLLPPVAVVPASAAPATAPFAAPVAAPTKTLPITVVTLLIIPGDDFVLVAFLLVFFFVAPPDFLEPDCFLAVPVAVDFFFAVFLVAIVFGFPFRVSIIDILRRQRPFPGPCGAKLRFELQEQYRYSIQIVQPQISRFAKCGADWALAMN